jgi:multiple antibiotic resistance protein
MDMLRGERRTQEGREEVIEGQTKEDVAIMPLAIPMLSGPGAISTVIVLAGQAGGLPESAVVYGAVIATGIVSYSCYGSVKRCCAGWAEPGSES